MKSAFPAIGDYYPLCYDIGPYQDNGSDFATTLNFSAEELTRWAGRNHLTELQTLALLTKNAFEGHLCHLNGLSVKKLVENGTIHIDFDGDNACTELACEFFNHLPLYQEGIELAWKQMVADDPRFAGTDIQPMLFFILTNQLFRLPVAYLEAFDTQRLNTMPASQVNQLRIQFILHSTAMSHAAQRSFIEQVNDQYAEKFRETISRLYAKETVLLQLCTKLDFAHDPSVKTESELEKKYFEFLIASSVSKHERKEPVLNPELKEQEEAHDFKELLKVQIRKLYKAISKNCSEIHCQLEGNKRFRQLNEYFIAASAVYNALYSDLSSLMLQHSRLMLLLAKVINNRKINHLPLQFVDFTGLIQSQPVELREDDLITCRNVLQKNLDMQRLFNLTDYKVKYLKDEEMSAIHNEFLLRQIDYIEKRIIEVMVEIKLIMQNKAGEIA